MVLEAYFDESGHPDDPNVHAFSLIGFRATCITWTKFNSTWNSLLNKYGVPYFHHRELFSKSRKSPYRDWCDEKRKSFLIQLTEVITRDLNSVRGVVKKLPNTGRKTLAQIYGDSYRTCVHASRLNLRKADKVNLIFSSHKQINSKSFLQHHQMLANAYAIYQNDHRLGTLQFKDFRGHPPLQAADLAAWEFAHHAHQPSPPTYAIKLLRQMKNVIYY